ncbi:ML domain-containing protein [Diaporthe helianthi]|uniref:Phosphatidylglycerol/phosphatidylinositol transfer protein n=1 Tax=Diaporthe helianthi TaxID=158607 RepID=A0A2P5I7U3_DIAHE|nr:ML domain-containing protein [Diaporthe helianthi]
MRLSAALVALSAAVAHAGFGLNFGGNQVTVNEDLKIPGDSPLELCPKAHDKDVITIDKVDLVPNPPKAGHDLIIKASGTVSEPIEEGAYVALQVKYGLIRLISTKADLCEQVKNVDLECPIDSGNLTLTKTVELPKEIPNVRKLTSLFVRDVSANLRAQGKYTVLADVYTKDDKPITCLTATVVFSSDNAEIEL